MSHRKITVTATGPDGAPLSGGEGVTVTTSQGSFMNGTKEVTLTPVGTTAECVLLAGTAFGVAALKAGAAHVTNLDSSAAARAATRSSARTGSWAISRRS
jgi:hypothetical protein